MRKPVHHHSDHSRPDLPRRFNYSFVLSLALVLVCLGALLQIYLQDRQEHAERLDALAAKTSQVAHQFLATDLHFLRLLAERTASGKLASGEFRYRASQYVTYHPYLINIAWADAGFVIRDTAPYEKNRQVIGLKLELPEPKRASHQAMQNRAPVYTRPFVVIQGAPAFEVYLPIYRGETFLGTFSGIYSIKNFLRQLEKTLYQEHVQLGLSVHDYDDTTGIQETPASAMGSRDLTLPEVAGLHLNLSLPPAERGGQVHTLLIVAALLGGLLIMASLKLNRELKRRRLVEKELRQSEQFYHSIYEHAGMGITLATIDGIIIKTNRAFSGMLGYAPGELDGVGFDRITHPDDLEKSYTALKQRGQGKPEVYSLKKRYLGKMGQTVWTSLVANYLLREDGSPEFMIGTIRDITEQHRAEEALTASEKQYRTLFQSMAQGVLYFAADGRISSANHTACELLGLSEEQLLGRSSFDPSWKVIREDGSDFPGAEHPVTIALETGREVRGVTAGVYNPQSDDIRWLNISAIPEFRPGEENPFRAFITLHDFSERKLAMERLKRSEADYRLVSNQFQTLLDAIPDPMYMLDRDFALLWRNQAADQFFGAPDGDHNSCFKRFWGRQDICNNCVVRNCLQSGQPEEGREVLADGRLLLLRAFPVKDDGGVVARVLMLVADQTDKLHQQQTMLRAGQLAAVGELAAGVAHEINNPINGIINYAQILCNRIDNESFEHQIAQRVMDEGERIATIASSLLSYTRENAAKKRRIPLDEILSEVMLISGTKLRNQGISVTRDIPGDLPDLMASPQQLQQVFLNLLSNARYALAARSTHDAEHEKTVTIQAETRGDSHVRITVRDNGCGIPEQLLARIQEPFFTTKPGQEGTGLGLSICNDILDQHGSRLHFESREGAFTAVSFEIPCS